MSQATSTHSTPAATNPSSPSFSGTLWTAIVHLDPRHVWKNPVVFCVWVGSVVTTVACLEAIVTGMTGELAFTAVIALSLWLTVLFANYAEASAEARGQAQAASLRAARSSTRATWLSEPRHDAAQRTLDASELQRGDHVLVRAGELIPADGEIVEGVAYVDESAITGESAPVIRESGGDHSAVTGGTRVITDWIVVRVSANRGEGFLEKMIALVEGAMRKKTPNEIALDILLAVMTLVFLVVTVTLATFADFSVTLMQRGAAPTIAVLVALFVCLIPTTIGGLLSAIGIAGMNRLVKANVLATSGRAVEAAGNASVLLLDKTGTITHGNRLASALVPAPGIPADALATAAWLTSMQDDTPEGRSLRAFALENLRGVTPPAPADAVSLPFSAETRMSGVDVEGRRLRKGASDSIRRFVEQAGGTIPEAVLKTVTEFARRGSTPLVIADGSVVLGTVELRDVVKTGVREKFAELRAMGIRTVMITGDNPLTAATIAGEAGVDEFIAEATPEAKLARIRQLQDEGHVVAMTGDGTNDAPALAQADVAVAMQSGTQAAKEAANMVDLDSDPTKLIRVVEVGKQLLVTRGALTTFSLANDVSKYFVILPAAFGTIYPELGVFNVLALHSPESAIISVVVFNALVVIALIPLALRGVRVRATSASETLARNLLIFGLGGILAPFPAIKGIDLLVSTLF